MANEVVVALGSNIDPGTNIPLALQRLADAVDVVRQAPVYETDPIGRPDQPRYWNTAVRARTPLGLAALREALRGIEHDLGRRRTDDRYAARTIDLDVVWCNGRVTDPDVEGRDFLRTLLRDLAVAPPRTGGTGRRLDSPAVAAHPSDRRPEA